jgi:hypothetical protein
MQSLTKPCVPDCAEPCGICGTKNTVHLVDNPETMPAAENPAMPVSSGIAEKKPAPEAVQRFVLSFSKRDEAAFIPHLGLLEIWHKAFQRSGLPVIFTEGFNPLPRFELASSLSLGVFSECEIASFMLYEMQDAEKVRDLLNESLPMNIRITEIFAYPLSRKIRREALSKYLWGNSYRYEFYETTTRDMVLQDSRFISFISAHPEMAFSETDEGAYEVTLPFALDRPFRDTIAEITGCQALEAIRITKLKTLAVIDGSQPESFFSVFGEVSNVNKKLLDTDC